jgi:hypothetical protein
MFGYFVMASGEQRSESRGEFEQRLRREGRYDKYRERRAEVKAQERCSWARAHILVVGEFGPVSDAVGDNTGLGISVLPNGMELVDAKLWRDRKKVDMLTEIEWVREHLPLRGIGPRDAPSASAWAMFWNARSSVSGYNEFMDKFASKLMPSRAEIEARNARKDDGGTLEFLREARKIRLRAERTAQEERTKMGLESIQAIEERSTVVHVADGNASTAG